MLPSPLFIMLACPFFRCPLPALQGDEREYHPRIIPKNCQSHRRLFSLQSGGCEQGSRSLYGSHLHLLIILSEQMHRKHFHRSLLRQLLLFCSEGVVMDRKL